MNRPLSGVCEEKKTVIEQNQPSGVWGEGKGGLPSSQALLRLPTFDRLM